MPETNSRNIVPPWRRQIPPPVVSPIVRQPQELPPASNGRPLAIEELLRMAGVSDAVTAPQPLSPELTRDNVGKVTQYLPREQYQKLGLTQEQIDPLLGGRKRELSDYQKFEKAVLAPANTPITVGPVTMKAGEWVGLFGLGVIGGVAVVQSLPVAYNALINGAFQRNINKVSMETNTPVNPQTARAVADYLSRQVRPSFANASKAIKELFKPTGQGKFAPTPQATAQADKYATDIIRRILPEFSKTRTDQVIAGIQSGKYSDIIPPSVQAVKGVVGQLKPEVTEVALESPTYVIRQKMTELFGEGKLTVSNSEFWGKLDELNDRTTKLKEGSAEWRAVKQDIGIMKAHIENENISRVVIPKAEVVTPEVQHAKGVLAARDLGGVQFVGAKNIKAA